MPPAHTTGLYHLALVYPTRQALARAALNLSERISHGSDHGVSEAVYLTDPDGNGVELYWDRPEEEWPRPPDGKGVAMVSEPVDLQALLAEAPAVESPA